jgi:WD40 repeat protein
MPLARSCATTTRSPGQCASLIAGRRTNPRQFLGMGPRDGRPVHQKGLPAQSRQSFPALGQEIFHHLEGHSRHLSGVAVTADGKRAVSASMDHTLNVWDLDTGLLIATFHRNAPARCRGLADERRTVAGEQGGRVYLLWLEESGARRAETKAKARRQGAWSSNR